MFRSTRLGFLRNDPIKDRAKTILKKGIAVIAVGFSGFKRQEQDKEVMH